MRKSVRFKCKLIGNSSKFTLHSHIYHSLQLQFSRLPLYRSLLHVILLSVLGIIFGLLSKFAYGRKLLLSFPKVFSLGLVSHEGPTEETLKKTKFSITFFGDGWPKEEALSEPTDSHTTPPSKKLVTRVSATNPGTLTQNHHNS